MLLFVVETEQVC